MKFELDDIMTTQEAAERWNIAADTIKQICIGRMKKKALAKVSLESQEKCG